MSWWLIVLVVVLGALALVALWDITQKGHAILRNFPVIGHLRYLLEAVGPELRQYIVTDNDEERPFTRDERRWVYATAKKENPFFGFGTDDVQNTPGYVLIKHAAFPHPGSDHGENVPIPAAKVLGARQNRPLAFRPASIINISAMSFGSLSGPAVEALNRGSAVAGVLHNTGEGGISTHHLHGADLIYQLGTGYFGARGPDGGFSMERFLTTVAGAPVKAIEIKLSQGAKPGKGGVLPAAKVTKEIADTRGVPVGVTVASPARHAAFDDVQSMVAFIEELAGETGLPVGIKSAVGEEAFWSDLADHMADTGDGPDFITIDGGEGGTGAAPLAFADHVALPFRRAFSRVYGTFATRGLQDDIVFIGSGRLGFGPDAAVAMALGADLINVGREAMLAIGCIQAQRCHTGHCPTGVATHNKWLTRGLDPMSKSTRLANYLVALRAELLSLAHAAGVSHPSLLDPTMIELVERGDRTLTLLDHYDYSPGWRHINPGTRAITDGLVG